MSEPVTVQKAPGIIRTYEFTWSDAAADPITDSVWTPVAGITIDADSISGDGTATILTLSSGTVDTDYRLLNEVAYTSGQTDYRWVTVEVRERISTLPALDATVGGESANSNISLAAAEVYFARRLYSDNWFNATSADKETALIMATARLEQESFAGRRTSLTQALQFPRTGIYVDGVYLDANTMPTKLLAATCEYALEFLGSDVSAQSDLVNYKKVKVGPIEIEMNQPVTSGVFPSEVARLLRDLRISGSGAAIVRA